jgi:membrane fusion protein, multidrug efflux system
MLCPMFRHRPCRQTVLNPRASVRGFGAFTIVLLAALGVLACSRGQTDDASPKPSAAPVEIAAVVQRDLPVEISAIGTVEATNTVAILPQVAGRINTVEFEEGAFVKRNDPLFTIDTRPYNASLSAAQAELVRSEATAEQAEAEAERYEALSRQGLASSQEVVQRKADLKSATAAILAARAAISAANLNVQFTTIRAPIDGRTGQLLVTAGNIVQPGGVDPLVVIRSLSPVKVSFNVPPKLLPQLRENGRVLPLVVRATTRGASVPAVTGHLTFVDNTVDPLSGSLMLKATFENTNEALWPGDFVDVVLVVSTDNQAVVAPEAAIAEGQQGAYAFVVDEQNIAHFRSVGVRRRTGQYVVVDHGLVPGEQVVVNGIMRLRDKTAVSLQAPSTPLTAATRDEGQGP